MPLHRRIPKRGFSSRKAASWLRLPTSALSSLQPGEVTVEMLRKLGIVNHRQSKVKFYKSGEVSVSYVLVGISATAGAGKLIEAAGGKLMDMPAQKPPAQDS